MKVRPKQSLHIDLSNCEDQTGLVLLKLKKSKTFEVRAVNPQQVKLVGTDMEISISKDMCEQYFTKVNQ